MTDYRRAAYQQSAEDRSLLELLSEGRRDKKGLKEGIAIMEKKREQQKMRENALRKKLESLRSTLYSLQNDKGHSIAGLKDEIHVLRGLKREPFLDDNKEFKREEQLPREKPRRRMIGGTRIQRTASVSSVPVYDRKMYIKKDSGRPLREKFSDQRSERPAGNRPERQYERLSKPEVRNRRRSAPSPHAAINVGDGKVEDAVRAFLDIFSQLRPKAMMAIWKRSAQTEEKGNMKLLHTKRLGPFLHELVVYAFMCDNPDKPKPSSHRTKPVVQMLRLRLLPYIQKKKNLDLEDFKMFPIWLEKRGKPLMGSNERRRDSLRKADLEKRKQLKIGSKCYIWSVGGQVWHNGEVVRIKRDAQGEWLVVRYFNNSSWLEKEVQRYSQSLTFSKKKK